MVQELFLAAEIAFQKNNLDQAAQLCLDVLERSPQDVSAMRLDGLVACRQGRIEHAINRLRTVLKLSPGDYLALTWLQASLRGASRYDEAIEVGVEAMSLWPNDPEVLINLGLAYRGARNARRAVDCLAKAAELQPSNHLTHHHLGLAYELLGVDDKAADAYQREIELAPRFEMGYICLGKLMIEHGSYVQVLDLCKTAVQVLPKSAQIHFLAAQAYRAVRDQGLADKHLRIAISLNPQIAVTAALWLNQDGKFEEAADYFEQAIRQNSANGQAYAGLVQGRRITEANRKLLSQMEALIERRDLHSREKSSLHYGLGKAYNDLKEFERAMAHFDAANKLIYNFYLTGREFDPAKSRAELQETIEMFSSEFMKRHRFLGSESRVPIFVVGMIRSGTTLVEQIISSHPDVDAAGEQRFWITESPRIVDPGTRTLNLERFREVQERYVKVLRGFQPHSSRVTDKMPLNFYRIGLIHLAFPYAPIVHVQRNPVDNALSIYMTELGKPPEFAHEKSHIVQAYRFYLKIMQHWREVIPSTNLLEIQYEDIVSDQEGTTRKLLDFCGLDWNPACLQFHRTDRPVSTPSMWQVRQPLYGTSVEKWRNYEPWLGDFANLLKEGENTEFTFPEP